LTNVLLAAEDDPMFALEYLRLRYPQRYSSQPGPAVPQWDIVGCLEGALAEHRAEQTQIEAPSALQIQADQSAEQEIERLKEPSA